MNNQIPNANLKPDNNNKKTNSNLKSDDNNKKTNSNLKPDDKNFQTRPSDVGKMIWYLSFLLTLGITLIINIVIRNNFVKNRTKINQLRSGINIQLKKRRDTLIKLVSASKDYIKYEKSILTDVTKLRKLNVETNPNESEKQMKNIFTKITAIGENYPDLKANTTVLNLMDQASYLEREIAASRRLYNQEVNIYNARLYTYPSNIAAYDMHLQKMPFIQIDPIDAQDVDIKLN